MKLIRRVNLIPYFPVLLFLLVLAASGIAKGFLAIIDFFFISGLVGKAIIEAVQALTLISVPMCLLIIYFQLIKIEEEQPTTHPRKRLISVLKENSMISMCLLAIPLISYFICTTSTKFIEFANTIK
jgi:hypothetical protein